jgi:tyrosinase
MQTRKNIRKLSNAEKRAFVNALLQLKKQGRYDQYIEWHHHAMMCPTPLPNENPHWRYRNAAHRGPVFGPWHRDYILQLEKDLQKIDKTVVLPYWDWSEDAQGQGRAFRSGGRPPSARPR